MAARGEAKQFYTDVVLTYEGSNCLFWPYNRNSFGYGRLKCGRDNLSVHRLVCEAQHGPPPTPGHEAAHSCGRGHLGCVSRWHLSWKTKAGNQADRVDHGTSNHGARNGRSKLTEADVLAIITLKGKSPKREIADRFGVSVETVSHIHTGRKWGWLTAGMVAAPPGAETEMRE